MAITLREDQEFAVNQTVGMLNLRWPFDVQSVLGIAPVRYGKTFTCIEIANRYLQPGEKLFIATPSIEVVNQWASSIREHYPRWTVGVIGGGKKEFGRDVTVGTIRGLSQYVASILEPAHKLLIFDEAHRSLSPSGKHLVDTFLGKYKSPIDKLFGRPGRNKVMYTTATPGRSDGQSIQEHIQSKTFDISPDVMRKRGVLVDVEYVWIGSDEVSSIVSNWLAKARGKQTIAFVPTKVKSERLAEEFRRRGVSAVHVTSDTPKKQRDKAVADYRAGRITVICNARIFTEGVDINMTEAIILSKRPKSDTPFIQMAGRARGSNGKKDKAIVFICDDDERSKPPSRGRIKLDLEKVYAGVAKTSILLRALTVFINVMTSIGLAVAKIPEKKR